ncbi:hypothetical protein [Actinoallomurus sp. CA-150999]|uniref:hypothetical protein n=1 Tax=Actinoallomurus sp. CA-150999 TaxID=3239887 RepID=UPI003D950589
MTPEEALREIRKRDEQTVDAAIGRLPRWYAATAPIVLFGMCSVADYTGDPAPYIGMGGCLLAVMSSISIKRRNARLQRSRYTGRAAVLMPLAAVIMLGIYVGLRSLAGALDLPLPYTIGAAGMTVTFLLVNPWLYRRLRSAMRREG